MIKGYYLIGRDIENSKCYNFGIDKQRFSTVEEALQAKDAQDDQYAYDQIQVEILEVE